VNSRLADFGYIVLRFTSEEINKECDKVKEILNKTINYE